MGNGGGGGLGRGFQGFSLIQGMSNSNAIMQSDWSDRGRHQWLNETIGETGGSANRQRQAFAHHQFLQDLRIGESGQMTNIYSM